jgi:hypothetical protein
MTAASIELGDALTALTAAVVAFGRRFGRYAEA